MFETVSILSNKISRKTIGYIQEPVKRYNYLCTYCLVIWSFLFDFLQKKNDIPLKKRLTVKNLPRIGLILAIY